MDQRQTIPDTAFEGPSTGAMHRILQMTSFSRCGETLLLRCLNAHPDIHVVHQILAPDEPQDFGLFRHLQTWPGTEIPHDDEHVRQTAAQPGQVLVVKNAVWEHHFPYRGFVLARNPFAVYRSFGIQNEGTDGFLKRKEQFFRWAAGIDTELVEVMKDPDNLACFSIIYNRKLFPLTRLDLPVVHYELFVQYPEQMLRWLLAQLGIPWSPEVLRSHEHYEEGQTGHGGIKLWRPIHTGSLHSYQRLPREVLQRVYAMTYPTLTALGYEYRDGRVDLLPEYYRRIGVPA